MKRELETALASLRDTFAVAALSEGGLLLHLRSGDFFELDASGALIWRCILQSTDAAHTANAVAKDLQVSSSGALDALERVARQGLAMTDQPPSGILRFDDDGRRLSLRWGNEMLVTFDRSELRLTAGPGLLNPTGGSGTDIDDALRIFVPKVLGTWFPLTLHASAIERGGKATLFSGESGAGKTTTARMAVEELTDVRLLAEDVSLLTTGGDEAFLVDGAEAVVHPWIDDAAATLAKRDGTTVDVEPLRRALALCTRRVPLRQITFFGRAQRRGSAWQLTRLPPSRALKSLLLNSFPHSAAPHILRDQLAAIHRLAILLPAWEAEAVPEGLSNLRAAIRVQSETIAS